MRDCGEQRNVVAEVTDSIATARAALPPVQTRAADAYVKRCAVVPRSLLALRISAVDASIGNVPEDSVNWDDTDRVSSSVPLPNGRVVVVVRCFVDAPDDALEGRRQRVVLVQDGRQIPLENDCPSAGSVTTRAGYIAFQCAREQAADEELHGVTVFDPGGQKLGEIARCRSPTWARDGVACQAEAVDAAGQLKLQPKTVRFADLKREKGVASDSAAKGRHKAQPGSH